MRWKDLGMTTPRMTLHREDASVVAHELSVAAGRAFKAGFYATGKKMEALAARFRDHAAPREVDEDGLGRRPEPVEKPDCQPSNPDECPVCRGGRCRGEPS